MKKQVIVIGNGFASMFFIRYDITVIKDVKLICFPSIRCFGLWWPAVDWTFLLVGKRRSFPRLLAS
jgi:hypothetical protein